MRIRTLQTPDGGLECKRCGCRHFVVIRTERNPRGYILRRRQCRNCGKRITTKEQPVTHD